MGIIIAVLIPAISFVVLFICYLIQMDPEERHQLWTGFKYVSTIVALLAIMIACNVCGAGPVNHYESSSDYWADHAKYDINYRI